MYKKKLGVRVVTAITVGSLLCSNASVAMAAEEVSSIIKEHSEDAEKTETPEEEVTETEEVVEETTEVETEVEAETEAETETETETETEVETEAETETEVEAEEELENDFEEVELETEVQKAPAVEEAAEELQDNVSNEKTVTVKFVCNGEVVDEFKYKEIPSVAVVHRDKLEKELDPDYKLADSETEWFNLDGNAYGAELEVEVIKIEPEIPESLAVYYVDETGADLFRTFWFNLDGGAFDEDEARYQFNVDAKELSGYEYVKYKLSEGKVTIFVKKVVPEETHRDLMVNYVTDMENPPVLSQSIKVEKNQEFLKLDSLNIPAGYVLGDNGGDSIYIADLTSVYVFVKEKPFEPEETHRDLMINYVIDMENPPVLSQSIKVEKNQEFLKLDSLNIPAGYVLGDNGGDSIYIEDLTSVYVFVKEKPFEPEETHRDLMVNYIIDMDTPVLSETIQVEKGQEFLKLDSLNIPAGYVLGDNDGDSIYIADLNSVFVYVKEDLAPEIPESLDVYYVDENGADLLHTFWLNQDGGSFDEEDARYQFNVDANELSGYEYVRYELEDGKVTIHVKKAAPEIPESLDVYYVDENGTDLLHTFWLNQDGGSFDEEDARYQFSLDAKELSGYEFVSYELKDGKVTIFVKKSAVDPEVNSKDVTIHIQYYLHDTGATLKKEDKVVTVKEGEEPTLLKAADLGTITVDGKEYRVHASAENLYVEYNENINEYQWAVAMEETATEPEETYADATLTVVYVDGEETVGTQVLKFNGLVGEEHTFTSKDLAVPENYEFVKAFAGHPVAYGAEDTVTVEVRKIELPTPDEKADATLHVSYIFNYKEIASEDITVRGKKGESYTFTADNLNIPSSYKLKKAMEPTEVQFGETYAITLELARRSSGGGSGSSGGGSGSGGGRSVSTAKKLTNGQWILDSTGWWYPFSDNTYAKGGWYYLEWQNKMDWYYFDNNGYLVSGWFEENGNKYYLHDVHDGTFGRMYLGWNKIGNQWYYFNDTTTGTFGALNPNAQVPAELLNQ